MNFFKRRTEAQSGAESSPATQSGQDARVKILGSGCAKCEQLEAATRTAILELGLDYEIGHVRDFAQIAGFGVLSTPALVVDGKVLSYGKVLSVEEVKGLFTKPLV